MDTGGSDGDSEPDAGAQDDPDDRNWSRTANTTRGGSKKKKKVSEQEQVAMDNSIPCSLTREDSSNFLKLCRSIQIFTSRVLTEHDLTEADGLMRSYCSELIDVRSII